MMGIHLVFKILPFKNVSVSPLTGGERVPVCPPWIHHCACLVKIEQSSRILCIFLNGIVDYK